MCVFYDGSTRRLTESGFMEKPGIEPVTPALQGIGFIPYTNVLTGLFLLRTFSEHRLVYSYNFISNGFQFDWCVKF